MIIFIVHQNSDKLLKILLLGGKTVGKTSFIYRFADDTFPTSYIPVVEGGFKTGTRQVNNPHPTSSGATTKKGVGGGPPPLPPPGHGGVTGGESNSKSTVCLQVWDHTEERFAVIDSVKFSGTDGIILLFDVTSKVSYTQAIERWYTEAAQFAPNARLVLVGNKSDVPASERQVTREEATLWAQSKAFPYYEVSAKTGDGVEELCISLAQQIIFPPPPPTPPHHIPVDSPKPSCIIV